MKFGDKLIQLRKKSGLSQEELAAKLNVSRQSVSKWESNNTYPETDKIVQICNIFDCTMDDLINENIKDITTIERKNKNQININISSLLDFVTKTINMFCSMKFFSLIKCLIEQAIIIGILVVLGLVFNDVLSSILRGVFSFLPWEILSILDSIFESILELIWIIITVIVVIHIFKIRYLNYYDEIINKENSIIDENINNDLEEKNNDNNVDKNKEKIKFEKKETRVVIRDREPFAFLNVLAKMILWFIKSIAVMIGLFFAFILLLGVIGLVLSISLSVYSNIFIGLDIGIIGVIIATILVLKLLIRFILESKVNIKLAIILFFVSIVVTGIGVGISLISIKDLEISDDLVDTLEVSMQSKELSYVDNMIIVDEYPRTYEYVIDNNIKDDKILVKNEFDPRFYELYSYEEHLYGMSIFHFSLNSRANIKEMFDIIIKDLKNNKIRDYSLYFESDDIKIVSNEENIKKLVNNFSKIYSFDKKETDTGFVISNISRRIKFIYDDCYGEYNALTGKISSDDNCKCIINDKLLPEMVEYSCHYVRNIEE